MRIGVVTTSYPRVDGEAAGSFVAAHVAALRAQGHEVDVIGAHALGSALFYGAGAPDELERGNLRTYLEAARFTAVLTATVARRARHWDLIVAHWLAPSALAALPSRVPLLAIAHGGDVHTLRRMRLLAPALYLLRARGAKLAFVSEELKQLARTAARRLGPYLDGAIVQPMGIDVARFTELARASTPEAKRPTILVVARLVPIKGVDIAIAAARLVRASAELVIAGDGPERAQLESLTRAFPAGHAGTHEPRVHFLGAVDATTRDQLLREAAVVVIPSRVLPNGRSEGMPMIALEALAAGVPVIASAVGGLRDLPGIVSVREGDPQALATAIDRVLSVPPPRVDVSHLDWKRVSARLLDHANRHASRNGRHAEDARR